MRNSAIALRGNTSAQANIRNPRSIEDKVDKVVDSIGKGIKILFKKNK